MENNHQDLCPECDNNTYSEADDYCEECGFCSDDAELQGSE